jgi:hypothetical protein
VGQNTPAQTGAQEFGGVSHPSRTKNILSALNILLGQKNCAFTPGKYIPSDTSILDEVEEVREEGRGVRGEGVEKEEREDSEPSLGMPDLLAFTQALAAQALDEGVSDLALRRAARALQNLTPLMEALASGDYRRAQEAVLADHAGKRDLLLVAQSRVNELESRHATITTTDVVVDLAKARLDAILTASAQRLQSEIFAMALEAQAKHALLATCNRKFDEAREGIVALSNSFIVSTAQLALQWKRRDDATNVLTRYAQIEAQEQVFHNNLLTLEQEAGEISTSFEALEGHFIPLRERGTTLVRSLREIVSASRILGVDLPHDVLSQIQRTAEPLETTLTFCSEQFHVPAMPHRDEKLRAALASIDEQRARKNHLLNPIRPSVFNHRLDRDEELRRLVLIAFHAFVLEEPERAKEGRGKGTGIGALIEANLIDETEREKALTAATNFKDASPKIMEAIQFHRFWRYRPTEEGVALAQQWLNECLAPAELIGEMEKARRLYNAKYRQQKSLRSTAKQEPGED